MYDLVTLIIADAALEPIPEELQRHPSAIRNAKIRGKNVKEMLLDRSYHHGFMLKMKDNFRRGRPDLVHFALLEATSTPLFLENHLNVCLHTIGGYAIFIAEHVRLPKSYFRFEGLMEKLFSEGKIISGGRSLIEAVKMDFKHLLRQVDSSVTIGLSRAASLRSFETVAGELAATDGSVLVVGGFPSGHFTSATYSCLDKVYSVSRHSLDANVVISRSLYEYEKEYQKITL